MNHRREIYRAASAPVFTVVVLLSMEWQSIVAISPFVVKFGVLSVLGALVSGLIGKDADIRTSIRKGIAAVILGTVLPAIGTMWEISEKILCVVAFGVGLCVDVVTPLLQKRFIEALKKWLKVN